MQFGFPNKNRFVLWVIHFSYSNLEERIKLNSKFLSTSLCPPLCTRCDHADTPGYTLTATPPHPSFFFLGQEIYRFVQHPFADLLSCSCDGIKKPLAPLDISWPIQYYKNGVFFLVSVRVKYHNQCHIHVRKSTAV